MKIIDIRAREYWKHYPMLSWLSWEPVTNLISNCPHAKENKYVWSLTKLAENNLYHSNWVYVFPHWERRWLLRISCFFFWVESLQE